MTLLDVVDLTVTFPTPDGPVTPVSGLSFSLGAGESLGVVGESGSGKSVTSMAIMGLLPKKAVVSGSITFDGIDLLAAREKDLCSIRGMRIAMIFQDALTSLNPVYTVGYQISEMIRCHQPEVGKAELRDRATDLLDAVGIPNPAQRVDQYPHEFSGGMRQRAMIAMAIANEPDLLIADEPTTALDVTVQAQVMEVMERIQERTSSSLLLITHDLGVVAGVADRIMVMYAGRDAEQGSVEEIFYDPRHPYTRGLLGSLPRVDRREGGAALNRIRGNPPSLLHLPPGCPFWPRCPYTVRGRC
ncbi:MAG: ABC transporter ATP-binding protein, partial [Microthrixaceae bacterium]|nr:ABC transporter ATP-binding protein [Microthrixaceae bacterium]